MSTVGESFLVGLIGEGVIPSLTPMLHEREADHHGLRYLYRPIDLTVIGRPPSDVGVLLHQACDLGEMITRYAWGTIWTRPGLDRRSRSLITLTALVARGHHEELAMHVRAALRNGLKPDEIKELLLQTAIYCGVPDANTAFRIARRALNEGRAEQDQHQKEDS